MRILEKIEKITDNGGLLTGDDVKARPINWMGFGERQAKAIVRPKSTHELSKIMQLCNEAGQAVVPLGGLSGLVQGTNSNPDDIVISLERMNEVESIDEIGMTAIVQAGTPLEKLQMEVEKHELLFALDLGARGSCTIGGNIATNAGGNQVIRYGMMREQVLGLEVVLADGTILSPMNALLKNNTGYDLKHLFIGSEGTLGIVTKAVLRLRPKPASQNTALIACDEFENISRLLRLMGERLGGSLSAFELMWAEHYDILTIESKRHSPPIANKYNYYVIIEQQGVNPGHDMEQFQETLEIAANKGLIKDAVLAQSKAQAQEIWNIREDVEGLIMPLMPGAVFDVSLPIREMEDYIAYIKSELEKQWADKAKLVVFGHLGDCNLHLIVSVGDGSEAIIKAVNEIVYQPLQKINGSVSAEHGIGLEKKPYLSLSRSPEEIAMMRTLKASLDPKNILNPGKLL